MTVKPSIIKIPHKRWPERVWRSLQRRFYSANLPEEVRSVIIDGFRELLTFGADAEEDNYLEIERALQRYANTLVGAPFSVVADDGSGNFTTITQAISAAPTDRPWMIFVKPSAAGYGTSADTVDLGGRSIWIFGVSPQNESFEAGSTNANLTQWTIGLINNTSTSNLRVSNLLMAQNGNTPFLGTFAGDVWFENCALPVGTIPTSGGATFVRLDNCNVSQLFQGGVSFAGVEVNNCDVTPTTAASVTVTLGTTSAKFIIRRSIIRWPTGAGTNFVIRSDGAGSTERSHVMEISDSSHILGANAVNVSFNNGSRGDTVNFSRNVRGDNQISLLTVALNTHDETEAIFSDNDMKQTHLAVNGASLTNGPCSISGLYRSVLCALPGAVINVMCDLSRTTSITALQLSGNNIIACLGVIPGTTSTGVNLSGNNNIVLAPNISACTTPSTISGTGNSLNALPPSGSAGGDLTGSYPNPTLDLSKTHIWTAEQKAPDWSISGLTGAVQASRWVGCTTAGAPVSGTFVAGDWIIDRTPTIYLCTVGGTPGTWVQISGNLSGAAGGDLAGTYPNPTLSPAADRSWNSHKITSLADPTNAQDAMTKNYADGHYVLLTTIQSETVYGTAGGTFSKASFPGLKAVRVKVQAGGGGSGGVPLTGAGAAAEAGGGGGGGYAEAIVAATSLGASETITVGAGGTAGASGTGAGGTGGTSSFGAFAVAAGGGGGQPGTATTGNGNAAGGAGGAVSAGDIQIPGGHASVGRVLGGVGVLFGGLGGASHLGPAQFPTASSHLAGTAGNAYGGGAAGGINGASQSALTGVAGADGVIIVELLY